MGQCPLCTGESENSPVHGKHEVSLKNAPMEPSERMLGRFPAASVTRRYFLMSSLCFSAISFRK